MNSVQHPGLGGQVERGDRLVADDQLRVEGEGAGDRDALPLPAGELPRQPAAGVGRQAAPGRAGRGPGWSASARGTFCTVSGSVRICSIVSDGFSEV